MFSIYFKSVDFQFFNNTHYLVQYHNAGAKKESVPGHHYFLKVERFINEHYEEGENYREFLKCSCQDKVGENCSFCKEPTGPPIGRCPKPFPNHACLPEYHYLRYDETPNAGRESDDWQPRIQLRKKHADGTIVLSDAESVAAFSDRFIVKAAHVVDYLHHLDVIKFKKKKRTEERAKESREAKERSYGDYDWAELCQDTTKMKKLRVLELNKYLMEHRLNNHLKKSKTDKISVIVQHWNQTEPESTPLRQSRVRDVVAADETPEEDEDTEDDDDGVCTSTDSDGESDNDVLEPGEDDDSSDLVLAVLGEENEAGNTTRTRSGRVINRRSEIDFFLF